ncbi:MAG TPA: class I SAM-dependent methyltransferase [Gammaproteobacteria bacterium]|nr:class I SAM-dependent methyltransferase [Gammaproteobacteria bacterium]
MTNASDSPSPYTGVENLEVMREAENYNRYLLALVQRHAHGATRMVDFGAGSGTFAVPCAAAGFDVTAVEPDEPLRAMLAAAGVRAVADAGALPDAVAPYVYTLNVLEHIPDDVGALRTLRAKLVPGGRLFVYVPAFPVLYTSMDAKVRHVRRYTRATLSASLVAAGLEIETMRYADSLGFAATLLFKALDNGSGDVNRTMLRLYDRLAFPVSRAFDVLADRWFGKNLLALARKPAA